MLIGNHKPNLRNVDEAARRRFNIVPFTQTPPVKDLDLEEKLKARMACRPAVDDRRLP